MEIAGYIASVLIGVSLGLIGGGGSILTVPVLVYLFRIAPSVATSYSLFIVGSSSLIGAWNNYKKGLVSFKTALLFGSSSIVTVLFTRLIIVPAIPEKIVQLANFTLTKQILIMVLFAVLMVAAAIPMISQRDKEKTNTINSESLPLPKLVLNGIGIGIVTGLLGAGGGFLLIPALVLLVRLPMKEAIGTSLLIIALNSLIGFAGDIRLHVMDWSFLLIVSLLAILGIFLGNALSKKVPGAKLKIAFGWFVLVMGMFIMTRELVF
jgi:uncharacterized membrane protein YfcA